MTKSVEEKVRAFIEKARRLPPQKVKGRTAVRNGSSLHMAIRTKEQADRFMSLLRNQ